MLRRDSRPRIYTELCNRSSTGSRGMGHAAGMPHNCDTFEDFWEDASVSLRSCHSLESIPSPWLGATTCGNAEVEEEDENKRFTGLGPHQIKPYRYSFDANEYMACLKGRRSFPPPLALCSTLSIKEGGRFVLKEMDEDRPQGFFRAQRGNGRLRLQLVLPNEVNEEDNQEESSSTAEDTDESKATQFGHAEHDSYVEETITSNYEDCSTANIDAITSNSIDKAGIGVCFDNSEGLWSGRHVYNVEDSATERPSVQKVGPEGLEFTACSTSQDVGMDVRCAATSDNSLAQQIGMKNLRFEGEIISALDGFYSDDPHRDASNCGKEAVFLEPESFLRDSFLTFGNLELNQLVAESSNSGVKQEPLWNVDVSNQAMASVSAWSPKQMCLHQSIVCMRPALGLAMS